MRTISLITTLLIASLTAGLPFGSAGHCTAPSTSETDVGSTKAIVIVGAGPFYLMTETSSAPVRTIVHIYQETNDFAGLQRRDAGIDDTCHGEIGPDRIVF